LGANANATFNFNGGALRPNTSTTTFMAGLTTANVRAGGAVIDTQGNSVTIAQPLLHEAALGTTPDGGLQKLGAGALTLTGTNTYTGPTSVSAGSLIVNGTHNAAGSYSVTGGGASSPATLGGAGTINLAQAASNVALSSSSAAPADNAVLSPGASGAGSIGTLTVNGGGNVVLGDNSTMLVDFSGVSSDRLTTDGAIDLTSPSNTLHLLGSGSGTFTIAQFAAYAGGLPDANHFENVLLNGMATQSTNPAGDNYVAVAYNANDITVTTSVPEPGVFGLLGLSAVSLLPRRRRRLR